MRIKPLCLTILQLNGRLLVGTTHTEAMRLLESDGTRVSLVVCEGLERATSEQDGVGQSARAREPVSHAVELGGLVVHARERAVRVHERGAGARGGRLPRAPGSCYRREQHALRVHMFVDLVVVILVLGDGECGQRCGTRERTRTRAGRWR